MTQIEARVRIHPRGPGAPATQRRARSGDAPPLWMIHASPASSISLVGLMRELGRTDG